MSSSLNKVTLIGNLGKDPEIRTAADGTKIATLSVATSESWVDRATNERKERTEWHRVVVFNPRTADIIEKYYKKGQKVYVEGQLQSRKFNTLDGKENKVMEVVIRFKGEIMALTRESEQGNTYTSPATHNAHDFGMESRDNATLLDDEIPF